MRLPPAALALALAAPAAARIINCQGSTLCQFFGKGTARELADYARRLDPARQYRNGEHVGCSLDGVCAFVQGSARGAPGALITRLAPRIVAHGCRVCGSVPLGDENGGGELTFNYVSLPACYFNLC